MRLIRETGTHDEIRCAHCGWRLNLAHATVAAVGYFGTQHRCEHGKCRRWNFILWQCVLDEAISVQLVGTAKLLGRDPRSVRETLRFAFPELNDEDRVFLATVSQLLTPPPKRPAA